MFLIRTDQEYQLANKKDVKTITWKEKILIFCKKLKSLIFAELPNLPPLPNNLPNNRTIY